MCPSGPLRIYSVHLDHISVTERALQISHLKERAFAYPGEGGAITGSAEYGFPELPCPEAFVLMGDFNMVKSSPEYVLMTGESDASGGRPAHHPVDASSLGDGLPEDSASWVDEARPEDNKLIDFAFVEPGLAARVGKVWIDSEAKGSDHQPLWFELA